MNTCESGRAESTECRGCIDTHTRCHLRVVPFCFCAAGAFTFAASLPLPALAFAFASPLRCHQAAGGAGGGWARLQDSCVAAITVGDRNTRAVPAAYHRTASHSRSSALAVSLASWVTAWDWEVTALVARRAAPNACASSTVCRAVISAISHARTRAAASAEERGGGGGEAGAAGATGAGKGAAVGVFPRKNERTKDTSCSSSGSTAAPLSGWAR